MRKRKRGHEIALSFPFTTNPKGWPLTKTHPDVGRRGTLPRMLSCPSKKHKQSTQIASREVFAFGKAAERTAMFGGSPALQLQQDGAVTPLQA